MPSVPAALQQQEQPMPSVPAAFQQQELPASCNLCTPGCCHRPCADDVAHYPTLNFETYVYALAGGARVRDVL
eukprot:CAMPEP_0204521224 /NCGR_PEP_ID=MMETSP0661-20131031/5671_1 /ASSEMBLY_ACC=CAM_ASM_000606 /TAXON_ID=109239 /ORGANISM="Alexandrium margalefi, Strain AMGDE01CS-322" /LENGTH=72 /DNA_ID=CAMNT_0051526809 /DNA_START=89 /DNA_END=304 /DNA_ORIENTATION=+